MIGRIDSGGRALVRIELRADSQAVELDAWVDTGFTGELTLPERIVQSLKLQSSYTVLATLADGSVVSLPLYACTLKWFGAERQIEVVANSGQFPLLGVGLLLDHKLTIDYPGRSFTID